jgi:hypothetical protein
MNWKLGLGSALVLALVACPVKPDDKSCDAGCFGDEQCDVETNICVSQEDAGSSDAGHSDAGSIDGGHVDGGFVDGGSDGGVGPCTPSEVCREAHGTCDLPETCNSDRECPPDSFLPSSTSCRIANSDAGCDVTEFCTGASAECPVDGVALPNVTCRGPLGVCDAPESCDGVTPVCPPDAYWPTSTVCHQSLGDCDPAESCTGSSPDCPVDLRKPPGTNCRASNGDCDRAEVCDGTSPVCPNDQLLDAGAVCRGAAGICDFQEVCTGLDAGCPLDVLRPAGSVCRGDAGVCDVAETCTGTDTMCPGDSFQSSGVKCADPTCSAASSTAARYCAGNANVCNTVSSVSCNGYQCTALGDTCRTACASNADCVMSTHFCDTTVIPNPACSPKRADGQPCTNGSTGYQCASNSCISMFTDGDHDGYGVGVSSFRCGASAPTGYATNNTDCCDTDVNAKPGQTGWFTSARTGCGGYDYDCANGETLQYPAAVGCSYTGSCTTAVCSWEAGDPAPGWKVPPACGVAGAWYTNCNTSVLGGGCSGGTTCTGGSSSSRTQGCH